MGKVKDIPFTQAELQELLDYNLRTGALTWRQDRSHKVQAGHEAGWRVYTHDDAASGIYINLGGRAYSATRIVWKWAFGVDPAGEVSHCNGQPFDLRLTNLRKPLRGGRRRNQRMRCHSTERRPGVSWNATLERWEGCISLDGRTNFLGLFPTKRGAVSAVLEARRKAGYPLRLVTSSERVALDQLPDWLR